MFFFFFNDTATTEIYTLSLHDALPIFPPAPFALRRSAERSTDGRWRGVSGRGERSRSANENGSRTARQVGQDRKSTRLNSSHANISYAVFCLKKKKQKSYNCQKTVTNA